MDYFSNYFNPLFDEYPEWFRYNAFLEISCLGKTQKKIFACFGVFNYFGAIYLIH